MPYPGKIFFPRRGAGCRRHRRLRCHLRRRRRRPRVPRAARPGTTTGGSCAHTHARAPVSAPRTPRGSRRKRYNIYRNILVFPENPNARGILIILRPVSLSMSDGCRCPRQSRRFRVVFPTPFTTRCNRKDTGNQPKTVRNVRAPSFLRC